MCTLGSSQNEGKLSLRCFTFYLFFQEGTVCNPKGRSCINDGIKNMFGCKTSCEGIHVDVQWIDEDVGRSKDGGREESKAAYKQMVEEYRDLKSNYSKAFRFLASAEKDNFGKIQIKFVS